MLIHTGQYKHYCNICRNGFRDARDYKEHVRAHQGLKCYCDYCAKAFSSKKGYQYHLSVHTDQISLHAVSVVKASMQDLTLKNAYKLACSVTIRHLLIQVTNNRTY